MNKFLAWVFTAFLTFALILSMMATVSAFAATPELSEDVPATHVRAQQPSNTAANPAANTADSAATSASTQPSSAQAAVAPSAKARPATRKVYLEDFQLIHQRVAQPRSTEMIWLGKSKRPN